MANEDRNKLVDGRGWNDTESSMLEQAWVIIANVNWQIGQVQSLKDWKPCVEDFRERYHRWLHNQNNPNQTERPEDTIRRYAGYITQMEEAVMLFPEDRLWRAVPNPNYEGWFADVVVDLLRQLRVSYEETSVLETEEQAPSVHKAVKYPIPRHKDGVERGNHD
jgi:hypothetical protein